MGFQGARTLETQKNPHLTVPKSGSKIDQQYVDGNAFSMFIVVQGHRKIVKVRNFEFSSFLSEKMCMFCISSWIIFPKFKKQAIKESQISAKIGSPHNNI